MIVPVADYVNPEIIKENTFLTAADGCTARILL